MIYVFNLQSGAVRPLRGHPGVVFSLAFAPAQKGKPPLLVSAANENAGKGFRGAVRLWDVARGAELPRRTGLPELSLDRLRPLAVWHTGPLPQQVRVALAWDNGKLRLWEADRPNAEPREADHGAFNNTIAYLPREDEVLTGSFSGGQGRLQRWRFPPDSDPAAARSADLPRGERPRSLAVFGSTAEGPIDRAAVVVEAPGREGETPYLLSLFDTNTLKPVQEPLRLWAGPRMLPVVTASPRGQYLAVAGNAGHEVHVFAVADLLRGRDGRQRLRGVGTAQAQSVFVKKGPDLGLALREARPGASGPAEPLPRSGDQVFDFRQRALTDDLHGWLPDTARLDGWEFRPVDRRNKPGPFSWEVQILHNQEQYGTVRLTRQQFPTAYALLPPRAGQDVPVLAVAYVALGQPLLALFDARSGAVFRHFTGHVNPIQSLAFSGDGKLLVSTAADQTVCVWGLGDLDQVLGHLGLLHGLMVNDGAKRGSVVVAKIEEENLTTENAKSLQAAGVAVGDVVEGFVERGRLWPLAESREFYQEIAQREPKDVVTLRIRGRGDVKLVVGQGIDEQKPLLTLFVTRKRQDAEPRRWIGWSPVGPYDCSDREAERLLGWHKNTGDAQQPTAFAPANAYRQQNYKPDILKYLVTRGNTGQAIEGWRNDHPEKPREPKMTLWLKEAGPEPRLDGRGRVLVTVPPATLVLTLHEPPGKVRAVKWQVDEDAGELAQATELEWTADLSRLPWKRGEHKVRVTLQTDAPGAPAFPRELLLYYQPRPPAITNLGPPSQVVDEPNYRLEAKIVPHDGQAVIAQVVHRHEGKNVAATKPREIREGTVFKETLALQPGVNQIKLVAYNKDAGTAEEAERNALVVEVLYKSQRPQIALTGIVPTGEEEIRLDPEQLDQPVVVSVPAVRIRGVIEARENLRDASWVQGEQRQPLKLARQKRLPLDQEVHLTTPGQPQKIRFLARAENSDEAERSVVLLYHPRLPHLQLTAPVEGQPLVEGRDKPQVGVEGRLLWPENRQPCEAQVVVNDRNNAKPLALTPQTDTVTASAALEPGENWVQVRLKNAWGRETITPKVLVTYRRPPRVVRLRAPTKAITPLADVEALVESAQTLPLTQLKVQGREVSAATLQPKVEEKKGDRTVWRIIIPDVPLRKGKNQIEIAASNRDGWSLRPAMHEIQFEEPAPPKAEARVLEPGQDGVVEEAEYRIKFQVRSRSPLKRVEVQRNTETVYQAAKVTELKANAAGYYEVETTVPVRLERGANSLKVVALNEGGEQISRAVAVTYQPGPVRIYIDHFKVGDETILPRGPTGGDLLTFPSLPRGKVTLAGHVRWSELNDKQMAAVRRVQVYVNGHQQVPVDLEPPTGQRRERSFEVKVVLERPEANQITVRLPSNIVQEANSRSRCRVDCAQPEAAGETRRQIHLLIVDTGKDSKERVKTRVLTALHATPDPSRADRFQQTGFDDGGVLYGPLVGDEAISERVYAHLALMRENLRSRAAAEFRDDVALVYFRGGETITGQGHFFLTSDSARDPNLECSSLPCDALAGYFADNPGAQLLLLDVTRQATGAGAGHDKVAANWPEYPHVALWRYAWAGQPQTQPDDARLIANWGEALSQALWLREVAQAIGEKFVKPPQVPRESKRYGQQLTLFEPQLSFGLEHLLVGLRSP
jgi:WD40 repeat protein